MLRRPSPMALDGLGAYYALVGAYFFAFGLQLIVFPSIVTFVLNETADRIGLAMACLQGPMFVFLLFGGVMAERAKPGPTLAALQGAMALPPLALALLTLAGGLSLPLVLAYALAMGTLAAFLQPLRDAALNGVVNEAMIAGQRVALASAAATTTAVQIAAQILGILFASAQSPIQTQLAGWFAVDAAPATLGVAALLLLQAIGTATGAFFSTRLKTPAPAFERSHVFSDVLEGLVYVARDRVMAPMLISAAYVGVFTVGSFQVLFPLILRESYDGGQAELALMNACFWAASLVAALALSRFGPLSRPGRALLLTHVAGGVVLASFAVHKPLWAFIGLAGVWGLAAGVAIATSRAITQSATNPRYLGRVLAVYSMGFMGGGPIGSLIVGQAAAEFGPRMAALVPAAGLMLGACALALFSPIWTLDQSAGRASDLMRPENSAN